MKQCFNLICRQRYRPAKRLGLESICAQVLLPTQRPLRRLMSWQLRANVNSNAVFIDSEFRVIRAEELLRVLRCRYVHWRTVHSED